MSTWLLPHTMEIVALADGRFGVRVFGGDTLPRTVGEFDTREEADAWMLQQGMLEDEAIEDHGVLKPGPSLNVS